MHSSKVCHGREPGAGLDNRAAASQQDNRKLIFLNNMITSREVNDWPENTFSAELAFPTHLASVSVSALEHTLPQSPKEKPEEGAVHTRWVGHMNDLYLTHKLMSRSFHIFRSRVHHPIFWEPSSPETLVIACKRGMAYIHKHGWHVFTLFNKKSWEQ